MASPAIESVDKRERRRQREQQKIASFKHALKYMSDLSDPWEALKWTYGLYATWDAVRRIASVEMGMWVKDVRLAWSIVDYVKALPDGKKRLLAATTEAVRRWEEEAAA